MIPSELSVRRASWLRLNDPHEEADRFIAAPDEIREIIRAHYAEQTERRRRQALLMPRPLAKAHRPYKIGPKEWRTIRDLDSVGVSQREIAQRLNVSRRTVATAVARKAPRVPADRREQYRAKTMKRKRENLKKNLELWKTDAELICLGRDLPIEDWEEILSNPTSMAELAAFTDFVHFLRHCRKIQEALIAKMLQTNISEVRAALASRK